MRTHCATLALALAFVMPCLSGAAPAEGAAATPPSGCLPGGNGYLRARIRGAFNLDIHWQDAELQCEGSVRPDGSGIRVSFAGPLRSDGRRLRMVFGVERAVEGAAANALPADLTVIFEGEKRLFSTRGANGCTVDKLEQERIGALGGTQRPYRVIARGFCIEPVNTLNAEERIVVSSFDFAGQVTFSDGPPAMQPPRQPPATAPSAAAP